MSSKKAFAGEMARRQKINIDIIIAYAPKGGGGKSFIENCLFSELIGRQQPFAVFDADSENPDVAQTIQWFNENYDRNIFCQEVNIEDQAEVEASYESFKQVATDGMTLLINTRGGAVVSDFARTLLEKMSGVLNATLHVVYVLDASPAAMEGLTKEEVASLQELVASFTVVANDFEDGRAGIASALDHAQAKLPWLTDEMIVWFPRQSPMVANYISKVRRPIVVCLSGYDEEYEANDFEAQVLIDSITPLTERLESVGAIVPREFK